MSRGLLNPSFVNTEEQDGKQVYKFDKRQHARVLLHNLIAMQDDERSLTDVIIISKDHEEFHFHAPILAASSKQLEKLLLEQSPAHATSKKSNIIIKEEFSSQAIQCIWDYAYKSAVIITASTINEVKELAEYYGLEILKEECELMGEEGFGGDHDEVKLEFQNLPEFITKRLYTLLIDSKLCSAFICGSEPLAKIPCHRAIIAATCSEFLSELTHGDSSESIQVNDTTFQSMAPFLRYLYTGDLMVEPAKVQQLLEMGVIFNLPNIEYACCCWLKDVLTTDNVLGIMGLAQDWQARAKEASSETKSKDNMHQCNPLEDLYQASREFTLKNFASVQETDEYLQILFEELVGLIVDDDLVVNSEEDVFHAVMKWVEFDPETRVVELPYLLQSVRLKHLSIGFLDTIMEHDLVKKNSLCVEVIQKALQESLQQSSPPRHDMEEKHDYVSLLSSSPDQNDPFDFNFFQPSDFNTFEASSLPDQSFDSQPLQEIMIPKKPDMRLRENRETLLERGKNIDGTPDKRLQENKDKSSVARKLTYSDEELPRRKDGQLDRRFKVVKELNESKSESKCKVNKKETSNQVGENTILKLLPQGPKRKDGQPDMRFKANRYPTKGILSAGPTRKDGQPDMRYAANKQKVNVDYQIQRREASTAGPKDGTRDIRVAENKKTEELFSPFVPLKKDGTPDKRFAVNKQARVVQGPLKANGTPDMRFAANKTFAGTQSLGPLKKDGTPDMRYRSNQNSSSCIAGSQYSSSVKPKATSSISSGRADNFPPSAGSGYPSLGGSSTGASGSWSSVSSSSSSGPRLKKDGTPDMRYSSNKSSTSSSCSSFGSRSSTSSAWSTSSFSSGYSGSSGYTASSGPLKKDGTPDMRYKANRR